MRKSCARRAAASVLVGAGLLVGSAGAGVAQEQVIGTMSVSSSNAAPGAQLTLSSVTPCFDSGVWGYAELSWDVYPAGSTESVAGSFQTVGSSQSPTPDGHWHVTFAAPFAPGRYEVEASCESLSLGTPNTDYETVTFDVTMATSSTTTPSSTTVTPATPPAAVPIVGDPQFTG